MAKVSWIGQKIGGRYEIKSLLGAGGMSSVYKAYDPNLRRDVAIKVIHSHLSSQEEFVRRFEEEAAAVARLRHPNLIQVYDFNHDEDTYYIVFEYVSGGSLHDKLRQAFDTNQLLPLAEAVDLTIKIGEGVDYAHKMGLVHRDIKPPNVLLNEQNEPILTDFGIVKIVGGEGHTQTGSVMGTARYMSPEQIKGVNIDHRTDVYALGVMLYEMVGGRAPFEADSMMTLMMMHVQDAPPDITKFREGVPASLRHIIEKALAKLPQERYQTAGEMVADLQKVQAGADIPKPLLTVFNTPVTFSQPGINVNAGTNPPQAQSTPSTGSGKLPVSPSTEKKKRGNLPFIIAGAGGLLLLTCIACVFLLNLGSDGDPTPTAVVAATSTVEVVIAAETNTPVTIEEATATVETTIADLPTPTTLPTLVTTPIVGGDIIFEDTFDVLNDWANDKDVDVNATVRNGVYDFVVLVEKQLFWSTGKQNFGDGIYSLDVKHNQGPDNNGFGMVFHLDQETRSFYLFEISSDGFVWIGYCGDGCAEIDYLVGDGWFASDAINKGVGATNNLRAVVDGTNMTFYVNNIEVGRGKDGRLREGDIAMLVETFEGEPGVGVHFDNFVVRELE